MITKHAEYPARRAHRWRRRYAFVGQTWSFQIDRCKSTDEPRRREWRCFVVFGSLGLFHLGEGRGGTPLDALNRAIRRSHEKLENIGNSLDKFADEARMSIGDAAIATTELSLEDRDHADEP